VAVADVPADQFDEGHGGVVLTCPVDWARATVVMDLRARHEHSDEIENRVVIEQAKGALVAALGVSAEEAFAMLRQYSQHYNVKVRQLARRFMTELEKPEPRPRQPAARARAALIEAAGGRLPGRHRGRHDALTRCMGAPVVGT